MKATLAAILTPMLLAGCQSNETSNAAYVDQDQVHQAYVAEYDEGTHEYYASACFRFGGPNGTTLLVDSTGYIKFDGQVMKRSKFLLGGVFYKYNLVDSLHPFDPDHLFSWMNNDKELVENPVSLKPAGFTSFPDTLPLNRDVQVGIKAEGLHDSELVVIAITDTATTARFKFTRNDIKNGQVTLDKKALQLINGQEGAVVIERSVTIMPPHTGKAGGTLKTKYRSRSREIRFTR